MPSPHPPSGPGLQPGANRCPQTPTDQCNSQLAYHILLVHTFHMQHIPFIFIEGTRFATNVARVRSIRSARHSKMYATTDAPPCVQHKGDGCSMANTPVEHQKHFPETLYLTFPDSPLLRIRVAVGCPLGLINLGDAKTARWLLGRSPNPDCNLTVWVCSVLRVHFYMYVMRSIAYTAWEAINRAFNVLCPL